VKESQSEEEEESKKNDPSEHEKTNTEDDESWTKSEHTVVHDASVENVDQSSVNDRMSTTPISPLDAPSYRTPMNGGESDTCNLFKLDEQVLGNI
jgi:hypothetical protein